MKLKDLIDIGIEIRDRIRQYIEKNPEKYAKIVDPLPPNVRLKDLNNSVHYMDLEAEYALNDVLKNRDLSAKIISEEFEERIVGDHADFLLVFDPIDGSTNAACKIPFYCTSLAYIEKVKSATFNDISMGVVCDIRGNNIYHAERGKGAFLNGKKISDSKCTEQIDNHKNLLSVFSYGVKEVPKGLKKVEKENKIRTLGSIALEMCFVAEGRLDGIIDTRRNLSVYDIAASALILKEADGFLTDLEGENLPNDLKTEKLSIIGTKKKELHDNIVKCLEGGRI